MHKNLHPKTKIDSINIGHMKSSREKKDFTGRISWKVRYDNKILDLENLLTIVERL